MSDLLNYIRDPNYVLFATRDGKKMAIPVDKAIEADRYGLYRLSEEELGQLATEEADKERYGGVGGQAVAGATGLARGATFGASDYLTEGLIGVGHGLSNVLDDDEDTRFSHGLSEGIEAARKTLKGTKEANQKTAITAEITGAIAPLLASGGVAGLGKYSGPVAAKALGEAAAKKSAQLASHIVGSRTAGVVGKAVGGAIETMPHAMTQPISELALDDDPDYSADNLISTLGMSALLGGTLGGAVGAAAEILPHAGQAIASSQSMHKVFNFGMNLPGAVGNKVKNIYAKWAEFRSGIPKEQIKEMLEELSYYDNNGIKRFMSDTDVGMALFPKKVILTPTGGTQLQLSADELKTVGKIRRSVSNITNTQRHELVNSYVDTFTQIRQSQNQILSRVNRDSLDDVSKSILDRYRFVDQQFVKYFGNMNNKPSATKLSKFLDDIDIPAVSDEKILYNEWIKSSNDLENILRTAPKSQTDQAAVRAMMTVREMNSSMQNIIKQHNVFKFASKYADKALGISDAVPFAVGVGGGGLGGGILTGLAARLGRDPAMEISFLRTFNMNTAKNVIGKAAKGVVWPVKKTAGVVSKVPDPHMVATKVYATTRGTLKKDAKTGGIQHAQKKEPHQLWHDEIDMLMRDQEALQNRLESSTRMLAVAYPQTAQMVKQRISTAVQFLQQKKISMGMINPLNPQVTRQPSTAEIRKYERYVAYTMNPNRFLKELAAGAVPTVEGVEVMMTVYPRLYARLRGQIEALMSDPGFKSNRHTRAKISRLTGIGDLTGLKTNSIYSIQKEQQAMDKGQQKKPKSKKPNNKGIERLVESEQTQAQRLSQPA